DTSQEYRLKILDSWLGRLVQRAARIGLKPVKNLPAGAHRPTELAIGMAADQIFESLPKDQRKTLKELPALVRRLEAEATLMRARVDELQALIADLGDEAVSAQSKALQGSQAAAVVDGHRAELRQ